MNVTNVHATNTGFQARKCGTGMVTLVCDDFGGPVVNIESKYLNISTSSKDAPSSKTTWYCLLGVSADVAFIFGTLLCKSATAAWWLT